MDDLLNNQRQLSRQEASDAVAEPGWRFVLGVLRTHVAVASLSQAAEVGARAVASCRGDADQHLRLDLRPDRVVLSLQSADVAAVTARDTQLAAEISAALDEIGVRTDPEVGAGRSVQALEIAVDAMDIATVRPFWRAVLGYGDEPGLTGSTDPLVDPVGSGPALWFQQMDTPRRQRNRIHLDVSVPHDEAPGRIAAALAAGGTLVSDARAPAFWVLADAEGNEVCVTTWQGRDG